MFTLSGKRTILAIVSALIVAGMIFGAGINAVQPVQAAAIQPAAMVQSEKAKYVFLFIGDGMGVTQRDAAELYKATMDQAATGTWHETRLLMNEFPAQGMTTTYDAGAIITDSASAGTAISTGQKTLSGVIGMDAEKKVELETIAETAHDAGMKIGIVTSVSLDHATPAVFYAHNASRSNMYAIAEDMVKSHFEYFAGGSLAQRKGKDGSLLDTFTFAKQAGYTIAETREDFEKLSNREDRVIAINPVLDRDAAMPYDIDRSEGEITLAEFTAKGIEVLDNSNGFFMMVEGGKIDWACHANDAMASIMDTLAMDDAIAVAYKFYEQHPDETLIIVTGDHETGGMAIGFAGTQYTSFFDKLSSQKVSYLGFNTRLEEWKAANPGGQFEAAMPLITESFGLKIFAKAEMDKMAEDVKAAKAEGASEEVKAAAEEAKANLAMALNDAEVAVLKIAFKESMLPKEKRATGDSAYLLYGGYEPLSIKLTTILNNKAGIGWTTYSHTGTPVQTSAIGVGSELFNGFYDNTEIYTKMITVTGLAD